MACMSSLASLSSCISEFIATIMRASSAHSIVTGNNRHSGGQRALVSQARHGWVRGGNGENGAQEECVRYFLVSLEKGGWQQLQDALDVASCQTWGVERSTATSRETPALL